MSYCLEVVERAEQKDEPINPNKIVQIEIPTYKIITLENMIGYEVPTIIIERHLKLRANSIRPQKIILFEGPSGTGKTTFVDLIIKKYASIFVRFDANGANLGGNAGDIAKNVNGMFNLIKTKERPILVIDECDELFASRADAGFMQMARAGAIIRALNQNIPNLLVICISNRPQKIDGAILDRCERIYCPLPNKKSIRDMANIYLDFINEDTRNRIIETIFAEGSRNKFWNGRNFSSLREALVELHDYKKIDNPEYKLTAADVGNEFMRIHTNKTHLKGDYLNQ